VTARPACAALAALCIAGASSGQSTVIDAEPLPLATQRIAASSDECVVWRREQAFARSVEAHDARAFQSFIHPGAVFNVGTADADRGSDAVAKSWAGIIEGRTVALRWRPGIVQIGGEPTIAISRGPYILERRQAGAPTYRVGMYQTVWVRDGRDGVWRILFDGSATTGRAIDDRAAAERWVREQAMSDCAS